jgi:hypothetical protein
MRGRGRRGIPINPVARFSGVGNLFVAKRISWSVHRNSAPRNSRPSRVCALRRPRVSGPRRWRRRHEGSRGGRCRIPCTVEFVREMCRACEPTQRSRAGLMNSTAPRLRLVAEDHRGSGSECAQGFYRPSVLMRLFSSSGWEAWSWASSRSTKPCLTKSERESSSVRDPLFLVRVIS